MIVSTIQTTRFLAASGESNSSKLVLFGCPFDGTCSFRPGARFGPAAIREMSDGLETYCPVLKRDLEEVAFSDVGDVPLPPGDTESAIALTYEMAKQVLANGQIPAALGGEHLLTLPLVRAAHEVHPNLVLIQFDAHMDMRNNYLGVTLSHATVMRRISEFVEQSRILQVGQRSGTLEEYQRAETFGNLRSAEVSVEELQQWVAGRPLYVTVDLDVLDPSVLPGTGTPEPGGISFSQLQNWLVGLANCNWIGWDVVELSPALDPSSMSSIVSAKIVRTMILASTAVLC
jgi:agmatinase